MTRKRTPSRTKRELEKLRRRRNGDGDDGPREVAVELAGVPARSPEDDEDRDLDRNDLPAFEEFRATLDSGAVETPETPDSDDLPTCATNGCPNPVIPPDVGLSPSEKCEACLGMPRRDWRPIVRENDEEGDA